MIPRRTQHRGVFIAAGLYNIGWGLWGVADPQWFFRFTGMPLLNHPAIFACLGMVIGLYGVLYLEIARRAGREDDLVIAVHTCPSGRFGQGWSRKVHDCCEHRCVAGHGRRSGRRA